VKVSVDGNRVIRAVVVTYAKAGIARYCNAIGAERFCWLIDNDRSLSSFVPREKELEFRAKAPKYQWAAKLISDQDFVDMLPNWLKSLIAQRGELGMKWMEAQIPWLRGFFLGG
jgi:hypothetical protein